MSNELTAEQIAAKEAAARAEAQSLYFLQAHRDYSGDPADNQRLADYLKQHGLEWTKENLEIAYAELSDQLKHKSPEEISSRAKKLTEQLSNPQPSEFPWGVLTKKSINRMRPEDMKRFLKDPRFAEQLDIALRRK